LVQMQLATDPLTLGLLQKYIPMPDAVKAMNITPVQFYGNIQMYWAQFAFPPFDLAGLTADLNTSIVMPRLNAQMIIDSHTYLTRLNTFISPDEMNKDPFFFETQDLKDLSNVHTATIRTLCGNQQYMYCNAPMRLELSDGRQIWMRAGSKSTSCQGAATDLSDIQALPASQVVWARELMGEGTVVTDNSAMIVDTINAHNKKFAAEELISPTTGAAGSVGGSTGAAGTSGISNGG